MHFARHEPEYWRDLAEEARTHVMAMITHEAKRELLAIAAAYVRLAEHVERAAGRKPHSD
jgi:hypothetical protein